MRKRKNSEDDHKPRKHSSQPKKSEEGHKKERERSKGKPSKKASPESNEEELKEKKKRVKRKLSTEDDKRKWKEEKKEKKYNSGKLTNDELRVLKDAICKYAFEQKFDENALVNLISERAASKTAGAWTKIADELPNRSVQSCHNAARRHFNPRNYKGYWSKEDEQRLLQY